MKYPKLLAASKTEEILAVIENLPVNANGFFLTAEQMTSIEAALNAGDTATTALAAATADVTRLTAELGTANTDLSTVKGELATAKTEITRLEGLGAPPATTTKDIDDATGKAKVKASDYSFQKELNSQI